ncbi:MAG: ATP-binding domain-containing protein, partial [Bacteroidetes bacterium]|nr:ATP-binding domain-containing protein [Bacteroidota bacterium]
VKTLKSTTLKTVLLAPTGRAAKVLSAYAGKQAFTIHKKIYFAQAGETGMHFSLQKNKHKNTVFIVDEASMIGTSSAEEQADLLSDLIEYVQSGEACRLMLIGDSAQLPPVGCDESPALDPVFLASNYYLNVDECRLHEVMRQRLESGILFNATEIRNKIDGGEEFMPGLVSSGFKDVAAINGTELEDALQEAYSKFGEEEVLVVTRSNRTANQFNRQIRARIKWLEDLISAGDQIMVVKNNYFWLPENSGPGFIANGDTMEITRIRKRETRGDFMFADAELRMIDYPDQPEFEAKVLLNSLDIEQASVPYTKLRELRKIIEEDYAHLKTKQQRIKAMRTDPYLNALQIKFAYAVTCHKAQGGQWKCVFVDQGYITEELLDRNYLRWLYTAVTRATQQVCFVNFNPAFYAQENN